MPTPTCRTASSSRSRMPPGAPGWKKSMLSCRNLDMSPLFILLAVPLPIDRTNLLVWRDEEGREHAISKPADWPKRRAAILAAMQEVMGPLPGDGRRVPLDVQIVEETKSEKYVRRKITFAAEKGD